jgi:hypothetical protein
MTPNATDSQLTELRQAIENWRRSRKPSVAMPEELWSAAVRFAAELGVGPVVKALKIDHGKLLRLVDELCAPGKLAKAPRCQEVQPPPTFLKVPAATVARTFSGSLSCMLEAESPGRGRVRAKLDNATALDVATILREFAR